MEIITVRRVLPASGNALLVTGYLPRQQALRADDLRRLPSRALEPAEVVRLTGRHLALVDRYRGVALRDILVLAGLTEVPEPALEECMIVVRAGDGYRALCSWSELHDAAADDDILVVFGRPLRTLDDHLGSFALISAAELRAGSRQLRQLREIKVLRISDG